MHPSPNMLSTVIGCEVKFELTKKGLKEECCVLKSRFLVKKRVIYIRFQTVETDKIESMTKKVIRNFGRQNGNLFLKKVIRKFGPRNFLPFPQNLAPSLRL